MPTAPSPFRALCPLALVLVLASPSAPAAAGLPAPRELRSWIEAFKTSPKGPFVRIRWFCKDGSVQPPRAYACKAHGGGIQHGEWNEHAKALRAGGYTVANVLADLDPATFVGPRADLRALRQILLERFLIGWDDGWIFRGARSYRGALQIEDEEAGARAVVLAMLADPAWLEPARFLLLRETVRLLPLQADEASAASVRRQALALAEKDRGFDPLRAKIHNQPDAGDAAQVRSYAKRKGQSGLRGEYERLAADIDALYAGGKGAQRALALAPRVAGDAALSRSLAELGQKLRNEHDPATQVAIAARLMGLVRKHLPELHDPELATEALQLSIVLESDARAAGGRAAAAVASASESRRLELLDQTAEALYGAGLLSVDRLAAVKRGRARNDRATLGEPPGWAGEALASEFGRAIEHLTPLEPEVRRYPEARIQASLVPFYAEVFGSPGR